MSDAMAMSFETLEYSGKLFNRGNTRTPLLSIISGKAKITDSPEFPIGQEYDTGDSAQPAISSRYSPW